MDPIEEMIADSCGTVNCIQPSETDHEKSLTRSIQDDATTSRDDSLIPMQQRSNSNKKKEGITPDTMFNNPSIASTILPLIFNYLNFFRLRNMFDVSDHFDNIIVEYINRLERKKNNLIAVFFFQDFLENINAEKNLFLMKYDKEFTLEKCKSINFEDFKFIMKSFGEFMKTIFIQTKFISEFYDNYDDYQINLHELFEIIKKYINKDEIFIIQIDDIMYNNELLIYPNKTFLPIIDLAYNSLNNETFNALIRLKYLIIRGIKLFTDYSELNINDLIKKYLMHLEIRDLTIAGPSATSIENTKNLNQCSDQILESIVNKSKNLLGRLTLKSCQIDNFCGLLNEFNNLNQIILDNIQHIGSNLLLMSDVNQHQWVKSLHIFNCPTFLDDDLCYEFITNYFRNLQDFRIANCDYVTGEFMYKLKERERGNELCIDLTHANKEIEMMTQIDHRKMPNGIRCTKFDYAPYSHRQIHKLISLHKEKFDYNYYDWIENMPHGFENVFEDFYENDDGLNYSLLDYFNFRIYRFHLDLSRFNRLNEKCLILIQRLISEIKKLSLNTYYTDIKIEKLSNFLREICTRELHISGYEYVRPTDERSGCDQIINALSVKSSESLKILEITDCSLGDLFFDRLDNFELLSQVILRNVHFSATSTFNRIHLSMVKEIRITNCPALNDEMCSCLIENCPDLKEFILSGWNSVTGSFLSNIDKNRKLSIHIEDAPGFFKIIKETPEALPQISENTKLYLRIAENSDSCEIFNRNCDLVRSVDHELIIFDDKFFKNLQKFGHLWSLTMSTFYTNVNWTNLCDLGLKELYLFNDKFYENDAAVDIISSFAKLNPNSLHILSLKMCKIDARGIESLKCFTNLSSLLFETMHGLTNELIAQLSVPQESDCTLKIIDNDYLDDETCYEIMKESKFDIWSVAKCRKITENFIEKIQIFVGYFEIHLDISGTEAGYTLLWNPRFLCNPQMRFTNLTYGTHVDYLRRIFDEIHTKPISKLPETLIECFRSKTLDLSDFHELNDAMFELVSQLENLGTLKIRSNYPNVKDPRAISRNLLKMKLHTLIVQGCGESSNSDNILEPFSYITNSLQEIHLINCNINTKLIHFLSNIRNLSVLKVFNQENDYTEEIVNGFHLNHEITLRVLVVNGVLINLD